MKNKRTLEIATVFLLLIFLFTTFSARSEEIDYKKEARTLGAAIWEICKDRGHKDYIMDCGEFLNNCTINKSLPWKQKHLDECKKLEIKRKK